MADPRAFAHMTNEEIYNEPSDVRAEEGVVSVKGPDAVDVKLTAEAADETSDRLLVGAMKARGQALTEKRRREARESALKTSE